MGSLIYVPGKSRDRKFTRDKRLETARRCGVKLIRLEWNEALMTKIKVEGFQSVTCGIKTKPGQRRPVTFVEWYKDQYGEDRPNGQLVFYPDDELGFAHAWLPDSPFNRRILAASSTSTVQQYTISDDKIRAEIDELADAFLASEEYLAAKEQIRQAQIEIEVRKEQQAAKDSTVESAALAKEEAILKKKLADLEAATRVEELREKIAKLEGRQQKQKVAKTQREVSPEEKKKIVQEVQAQHKDLIERLKKNHRNYWKCDEYMTTVQPEIDKRVREASDSVNTESGDDAEG